MAENNNPKFPERPADVRKDADSPEGRDSKGDDPLVELARIVSGRSGAADSSGAAKKPVPVEQPPTKPATTEPFPSESDLARDLEEELLNELQASFSVVPEVESRPAPAPAPPPAPPRVEPQQPAASPQDSPQASASPPSPAAPPPAPEAPPAEPEASFHPPGAPSAEPPPSPPQAPEAPQPAPQRRPPRVLQGQAGPDATPDRLEGWLAQEKAPPRRPTLADRIAQAARKAERDAPPAWAEASGPPPEPVRQPRPPAPERRRETEFPEDSRHRAPPVPNQSAGEPDTPPRRAHSRWDPPADPEPDLDPPIDAARFAPATADEFRPPHSEALAEPDAFPDEFAFPEGNDDGYAGEDDDYDAVPGYDDDEELLAAYSDDDLAAVEPPRSRRGPLAVAALIAIVLVVGGITMVILRSGGAGDPPRVISADASPTKIAPDSTGASEGDGQSKLIYDRVDPNSEVADSQLVVPGDEPIAEIPPIPDETSDSEVSRVILGGGPSVDDSSPVDGAVPSPAETPQDRGGTTIASGDPNSAPIGPKKVRTVVVRPDGTIVSSEAANADPSAPMDEPQNSQNSQEPQLADLPPASETPPAPAADENPLLAEDFGADVSEGSVPDSSVDASTSRSVPDVPAPAPAPVVRPPPANPTVVATPGSTNGPIDVTPGTQAPSNTRPAAGGGYLVQVSSQRSREIALASFAELQQRYPGILGNQAPDIQRADLGERGVYYRVRVGYPTREEAIRMCENLKAAGGDCLLASR